MTKIARYSTKITALFLPRTTRPKRGPKCNTQHNRRQHNMLAMLCAVLRAYKSLAKRAQCAQQFSHALSLPLSLRHLFWGVRSLVSTSTTSVFRYALSKLSTSCCALFYKTESAVAQCSKIPNYL